MDVLPVDYHSSIGGIAISAACFGSWLLELVDMVATYRFLDIPDTIPRVLHLLGVGSMNKTFPCVQLVKSGFLQCNISYDTTSHGSLYHNGLYFTGPNRISLKKHTNIDSTLAVMDVYSNFGKLLPISKNDFCMLYEVVRNLSFKQIKNSQIKNKNIGILMRFLFCMSSVNNFMKQMDKAIHSDYSHQENTFNILSQVKTTDDYLQWRDMSISLLNSSKVKKYHGENVGLTQFL